MKRVILMVGPQYSGKSTFCQKALPLFPDVSYVSRDEILIELFGTTLLSRYTGEHGAGLNRLWEIVATRLRKRGRVTLLLDMWNGFLQERMLIAEKLRRLGARKVDAWYFVTPLETCIKWSFLREPVKPSDNERYQRESQVQRVTHDYKLYHSTSRIMQEGVFHSIERINPLYDEPRLFLQAPAVQLLLPFD